LVKKEFGKSMVSHHPKIVCLPTMEIKIDKN